MEPGRRVHLGPQSDDDAREDFSYRRAAPDTASRGVTCRMANSAELEPGTLRVVMSADGSKFVYGYHKHLSELYVAHGLR